MDSFELRDSYGFDAISWPDNLSCIGISATSAMKNLECWSEVLQTIFNMNVKPDSKVVIPARTKQSTDSEWIIGTNKWKIRDKDLVLCSWLAGTDENGSEHFVPRGMVCFGNTPKDFSIAELPRNRD